MYLPVPEILIFVWFWIIFWLSFILIQRMPISISIEHILVMTSAFTWEYFNFSNFLQDSFARFRVLSWQFFSFYTWSMSSHCPWPLEFLVINKLDNLFEDPIYKTDLHLSCHFQDSLSFDSLIILCLSVGSLLRFLWVLGFVNSCVFF